MVDFEKDVLKTSEHIPVVVDFWAPWCGPCRSLGPIIESLAEQNQSSWLLVKVNTDEQPDVSQRYQIRGIPAVKMFHQGQMIAEFTGALPKGQIEQWLQEHLPDERKAELEMLRQQTINGVDVTTELSEFVERFPDLDEAKLLLAQQLVFDRPDDVKTLLASIVEPNKFPKEVEHVRNLVDLMTCELTDSKTGELIGEARTQAGTKQFEPLLESLVNIVTIDKDVYRQIARKSSVALFHMLGNHHELTKKYQRRLSMALN